jgi:hypothetical protein
VRAHLDCEGDRAVGGKKIGELDAHDVAAPSPNCIMNAQLKIEAHRLDDRAYRDARYAK